jgi:hypothetical protein
MDRDLAITIEIDFNFSVCCKLIYQTDVLHKIIHKRGSYVCVTALAEPLPTNGNKPNKP